MGAGVAACWLLSAETWQGVQEAARDRLRQSKPYHKYHLSCIRGGQGNVSKKGVSSTRLYNLPSMAHMVGGTLPFEGAHLIDAIRAFVAKQANVVPLFFGKPKH